MYYVIGYIIIRRVQRLLYKLQGIISIIEHQRRNDGNIINDYKENNDVVLSLLNTISHYRE